MKKTILIIILLLTTALLSGCMTIDEKVLRSDVCKDQGYSNVHNIHDSSGTLVNFFCSTNENDIFMTSGLYDLTATYEWNYYKTRVAKPNGLNDFATGINANSFTTVKNTAEFTDGFCESKGYDWGAFDTQRCEGNFIHCYKKTGNTLMTDCISVGD